MSAGWERLPGSLQAWGSVSLLFSTVYCGAQRLPLTSEFAQSCSREKQQKLKDARDIFCFGFLNFFFFFSWEAKALISKYCFAPAVHSPRVRLHHQCQVKLPAHWTCPPARVVQARPSLLPAAGLEGLSVWDGLAGAVSPRLSTPRLWAEPWDAVRTSSSQGPGKFLFWQQGLVGFWVGRSPESEFSCDTQGPSACPSLVHSSYYRTLGVFCMASVQSAPWGLSVMPHVCLTVKWLTSLGPYCVHKF